MKKQNSFKLWFILSAVMIVILACSVPGGQSSGPDLGGTRQALELQQTQMAVNFQQTALVLAQTKSAAAQVAQIQPTQAVLIDEPIQPAQATYTPYPTYTSLPQPTPVPPQATAAPVEPVKSVMDVEAQIKSANILIYEDIKGYFDLSPLISQAVRSMDFQGGRIVEVGDATGNFMTQLNSPMKWDLIIVAAESRKAVRGEFWDLIMDQVNKKVGLIAEVWYLDEIANGRIAPLLSKCGVAFQKDWYRDPQKYNELNFSLYWLDQSHELFLNPNMVNPLYTPNIYWVGDIGDRIMLGSGGDAQLIAGLFPKEKSSYGVLTSCLEGRMVLQTFDTHDYRQSQMLPLWQNYIYNTLKNHFEALQ